MNLKACFWLQMNFIASNHNKDKKEIQHFVHYVNLSLLAVPSAKIMRRTFLQEKKKNPFPTHEINDQTPDP